MPLSRLALSIPALMAVQLLATAAAAQKANPYYQLQCSMAGAYCDRVYAAPERKETFDELMQRRDREHAEQVRAREQRRAQEALKREQERLERLERDRQAKLAAERQREQRRQLLAERVANAPAVVRWFRIAWPVPQYILAGFLVVFATIAYIGARTSSGAPGKLFFAAGLLSGISLLATSLAALSASPTFSLFVALSPLFLFVACNLFNAMRGWHYLFVSHPATGIAMPPLREGTLFPKAMLGASLRPDATQLFELPPAYQSQNLAEKARALRDKIDADAEIAAAAMRRDRARAAKIQADEELRALRKMLPWWRRWLLR